MASDDPPSQQLAVTTTNAGNLGWGALLTDESEYVAELRWQPGGGQAKRWLDRMGEDPQVTGILEAIILPIVGEFEWYLDPNGADDAVVEALAEDLSVPIGEPVAEPGPGAAWGRENPRKPRGRARGRFSLRRHMERTLRTALKYGFAVDEQVGIREETGRKWWRLRKLSEIPVDSIHQWEYDTDGGLKWIKQGGMRAPEIPVTQLVVWEWRPNRRTWRGKSFIRAMYRAFVAKDKSIRIGLTNLEKAGGVPYATGPRGAADKLLQKINGILSRFRVGDRSAMTFPDGTKVDFAKGAGAAEAIEWIRAMNDEIALAGNAMWMRLGQSGPGSRALGDTLYDGGFDLVKKAVATWYADIFNEHVIEDWVDWNAGETAQAPLLCYRVPEQSRPDNPRQGQDSGEGGGGGSPVAASAPLRPTILAAGRSRLPNRALRREPTEAEIRAAVDFDAMDAAWRATLDALVEFWRGVRVAQAAELREQIVAAQGDYQALSRVRPTILGVDELVAAMLQLVEEGAAAAISEARAQGVTLFDPDLRALQRQTESRALAIAELLAADLGAKAARSALRLTGFVVPRGETAPTVVGTPEQVGDEVAAEIDALSDAYLEETFAGALTAAQNGGRFAAMATNIPEGTKFVATELLDTATCDECREVDETEWDTLAEAAAHYPTGGYKRCRGRFQNRCRGSVFARYGDEAQSTMRGDEFDTPPPSDEPGRVAAADWDPSKHPRGHHTNKGRFSKTATNVVKKALDSLAGDDAQSYVDKRHVTLTEPEGAAAHRYSVAEHEAINRALRGATGPEIRLPKRTIESIMALDSAIDRQEPTDQPMIVWRGVPRGAVVHLAEGDEYVDRGFGSTSTSEDLAESFRKIHGAEGRMLRITVPPGQKGLSMQAAAVGPGVDLPGNMRREREYLLPRNTTFVVTKIDGHTIHVEIKHDG